MPDGFNETPIRGKHLHNTAGPAETSVATLTALAAATDPAYNEGNLVHLSTDLAGNLRVILSGTEPGTVSSVDVSDRDARRLGVAFLDPTTIAAITDALESVDLNGATRDDIVGRLSTAIVDLRDTLSTNLEAVSLNADTRDDIVTRLTAAVTDLRDTLSTNLESIDLNAATLDRLTTNNPYVRGAAVGDDNPFPVVIQTNPGAIIDSGSLRAVDVAPGAEAVLDGPAVAAGATGRLVEVSAASSVRIRVALQTPDPAAAVAGTFVTRRVFFVDPTASSLVYQPVDRDLFSVAAGGTYRLVITNMDNLRTADVYGSLTHVEG